MRSPISTDASCYLANCAVNFANAEVKGQVALTPGKHRFESAAGCVTLENPPQGSVLKAEPRQDEGVVLHAPTPLDVQLANMVGKPGESYAEWGPRQALNWGVKPKIHKLEFGKPGTDKPLLTAVVCPSVCGEQRLPFVRYPALSGDKQVQDKWDALRKTVTDALCTGLKTILRHDMVTSAGLVDLARSDLTLRWQGGSPLQYGRTTVEPGEITLRVGSKPAAALGEADEVGARLTHDVKLMDADGVATPLRLKAKCLLDEEGPALVGNDGYPAPTEDWKRDEATPRYIIPAIQGLFTTAQATGSLTLGQGRVRCADLIGGYDAPEREVSTATALARNFALDLCGQKVSAEAASPEDGLTLRLDKPIRIVAPQGTGLLPSMLHWLDRLLARVTSFHLSGARILPDGAELEITGTVRVFGFPWPITTKVPMPDLEAQQPLYQVDSTLVDVERLLSDPLAYVKPIANLVDMKRTDLKVKAEREDKLAFGKVEAPQVLTSSKSVIVAKATKPSKATEADPQRFKLSYVHRTSIVAGEGTDASTRKVRVGASVAVPVGAQPDS